MAHLMGVQFKKKNHALIYCDLFYFSMMSALNKHLYTHLHPFTSKIFHLQGAGPMPNMINANLLILFQLLFSSFLLNLLPPWVCNMCPVISFKCSYIIRYCCNGTRGKNYWLCIYWFDFCSCESIEFLYMYIQRNIFTELMNLPNQIKFIETHKLGFNKCLCYNSLYTFFCFRMYITIQSIVVQLNRLLFIQLNWEENMNLNKDSNTYFQVWWEHKCYQWTMSQLVKPVLSNLREHKLDSTYTLTELHKFITIFCGL